MQGGHSDSQREGSRAALKCDMWAVGMIAVYLLAGTTAFPSSNYRTLVRRSHQRTTASNSYGQQVFATPERGTRSLLLRAAQAVSTVLPHVTSWIGRMSHIGTRNSLQSSSADDTGDVVTTGCDTCWMDTAAQKQIRALVDHQLTVLHERGTSPDMLALLQGLLEPDPHCRLSARDALGHPALRMHGRVDTAAAPSGVDWDADLVPAARTVALQLWGIVRQSRQQLVEMSRRHTLVSTLAVRRDALERLASLVRSTLGEQQPSAALDLTTAQSGKRSEQDGAHSSADKDGGMFDHRRMQIYQWQNRV